MQTSAHPKHICSACGSHLESGVDCGSPAGEKSIPRPYTQLKIFYMSSNEPLNVAELLHKFNYHFEFLFFSNLVPDSFFYVIILKCCL